MLLSVRTRTKTLLTSLVFDGYLRPRLSAFRAYPGAETGRQTSAKIKDRGCKASPVGMLQPQPIGLWFVKNLLAGDPK